MKTRLFSRIILLLLCGSTFLTAETKVVCLGDSITKRGFPQVLAPLLNAEVINAGVAGHNSSEGLRRIEKDVLDHKPDFVVVFFGTNDLRVDSKKHTPIEKYEENLTEIISQSRQGGAQVLVCTLPPIVAEAYFTRHEKKDYESHGGLDSLIASYREAAMKVAAKEKAPLIDLNQLLVDQPAWFTSDGVHPSPDGNAIIAKLVAQELRPLLPKTIVDPKEGEADIIVYGATSAGIMAAVQGARMGRSVILLGTRPHIGGLTAGGLGATDIGNKDVIGGLSREFYRRVAAHYSKDSSWVYESREEFFAERSKRTTLEEVRRPNAAMWTFEPHVAEGIFNEMLAEEKVPLVLEQRIKSVTKEGSRMTSIEMVSGEVYRGKAFIDATYEGDLMARAGVSYRIGREANALHNETFNGIRAATPKNQLLGTVDPYRIPGDPASGLLPLIQEGDGGTPGEGDHRVQAYNFRLCFTDVPENRLTLAPPKNYDPALYALAARQVEVLVAAGRELTLKRFCNPVWMPNRKTDINNSAGISTDYIGANYAYPDADYPQRDEIWQAHEDYVRGFWYFMSNDPQIPETLRKQFLALGPCKDEFPEADGWSRHLYVREARRMYSEYVMTEHNCRGKVIAEDSVGMAAYGMDSHNCQRVVQNGRVRNEGDVQQHGLRPYPISYRAIVPKEKECENLVVPVCVSSTHIAFGSIRMEPVFMVLGQSSATVASLAIGEGTSVQKVDYELLRELLIACDQVLARPAKK